MPAEEWAAEVAIDADIVRRVLGAQFPELALDSLRLVGEGWDNSVWLVDGRWIFRFPRREVAVGPAELQIALLPALGPMLPLPVPQPAFVGRPSEDFGWPFFGAPFLPGREVAEVRLDDKARARAAEPLARFLRTLHSSVLLEVGGVELLSDDPTGRANMDYRSPRTRERLRELGELGLWEAPARVDAILDEAERLPSPTDLVVAHGDLHLRHLLVADDGRPTAVIDWDDLCLADPAIDLMLYWCFLPPAARPAFVAEYGPIPEERLLRGRVLSIFLCGSLAVYGHHQGLPGLERESIAGIERALEG